MSTVPVLRYLIAGQLRRNYVITPQDKPLLDVPGGGLLYAAAGAGIWENGVGLIGRIGEDYPQEWLEKLARAGFDLRGIRVLPEAVDLRYFVSYPAPETPNTDNPVAQFARLGLSFPKALLGYTPPGQQIDSRTQLGPLTLRSNDLPDDYLDATAAHLCPLDFLSHTMLPSVLRRGNINTISLDPSAGYMNPIFWDEMPVLVNGLSAFLCAESKLVNLFQGRSEDLWEMAETIAGYGCEIVVIKRGSGGQYLYNHANRTRWMIPAYPVQIIEPTGAGDAFGGGFMIGYHETYDPLHAVLCGNISAAMVMEGTSPFYALDSLPGLNKARLDALREMVRKA